MSQPRGTHVTGCRPAVRGWQGFTLLEMLIALGIAAALMASVVPGFGPAITKARLLSATRDVASGLRHTRGQALILGQEAVFELDIDKHRYRVAGRSKSYSIPDDLKLGLYTTATETLDEGKGRIRFFPDGSSSGGRVTLIGARQKRVVDVNWLTGEVKTEEKDPDEE